MQQDLDQTVYVYHQRQHYQFCIVTLLFAAAKLCYLTVFIAAFKVGVGQIIEYYLIADVKEFIGKFNSRGSCRIKKFRLNS